MDLKRVYVLAPNLNGSLAFAVAPHSHGNMVMLQGRLVSAVTGYGGRVTTAASGWTSAVVPGATDVVGAIADSRLNPLANGWGDFTPNIYSEFRNIVSVADVSYTGTSLDDSGTVQIDHMTGTFGEEGNEDFTYSTNKVQAIEILDDTRASGTLANIGTGPRSVAMEARKPFALRVTGDVRYKAIKPVLYQTGTGTSPPPFGFVQNSTFNGSVPGPVYQDGEFKIVSYAGLNINSTITVTVRYCVQLTVDSGTSMYAMSQPSPPRDLPATTWYERFRSLLPTIEKAVGVGLTAAELFLPRMAAGTLRPTLRALGVPGAR